MHVEGVDPRDVGWDVDDPPYRVYFFDAGGASDHYRITAGTSTRFWTGRIRTPNDSTIGEPLADHWKTTSAGCASSRWVGRGWQGMDFVDLRVASAHGRRR